MAMSTQRHISSLGSNSNPGLGDCNHPQLMSERKDWAVDGMNADRVALGRMTRSQ